MKEAAELETQKKIFQIISKEPGLNLSKIVELINLNMPLLLYHVRYLEKHDLITVVKENGYTTHLLGFQHESLNAYTLGYDTVSKRGPEIQYSCKRMENDYLKFFDEHKNDDKPFYVCIGAVEVHRPFRAWAEPVDPEIVKIPPYLPDHHNIKKDLAELYGKIHTVEYTIGRILYQLETNDLRENTLFIYTTDHGEAFPRAKCTLYDPGIKTLLLMSWQNSDIFTKGKVINQMISNIDLLPTLLALIGSEIPENIEGRSFLPILSDHNQPFRKEIYIEKTFHEIYDPLRGIRTENHKYILNFEKIKTPYQIPADFKRSSSWRYMKKIFNTPRSEEELYDLNRDPNEMINLRDDSNYKEILKELNQKLFNWMKITNDPILKGRIKDQRKNSPKQHY